MQLIEDYGVSFRQADGLKYLLLFPSIWSLSRKIKNKSNNVLREAKNITGAARGS